MEGFEGIVGVGAGAKKGYVQNPKSAIFGKKDYTKGKKPTNTTADPVGQQPGEKKEAGPPLSLGVFGSGMQKKWFISNLLNIK